jgi:hypothetical protein
MHGDGSFASCCTRKHEIRPLASKIFLKKWLIKLIVLVKIKLTILVKGDKNDEIN